MSFLTGAILKISVTTLVITQTVILRATARQRVVSRAVSLRAAVPKTVVPQAMICRAVIPHSGSSNSDPTENSPITVQESPQSVGTELASIASDSHLVLDRYWRDSFNSNTTVSESGMHSNLCLLISHLFIVLLLPFAILHGLIYSSYVLLLQTLRYWR